MQSFKEFVLENKMINEALSKSDKDVIKAFIDKEKGESKKLLSDGKSLEGLWMGGKDIAVWKGNKIVLNDTGGKSAQTIHNFIRKQAPKNWIED